MEIDLTQHFVDPITGQFIKNQEDKELTLGEVMKLALTGTVEADKNITGQEKFHRWELYLKVKQAGDSLSLPVESISKIKDLIGGMFTTTIVGQAWKMIN